MNYRHAYHAGNFADVVKHAVLVWLLRAMARKDRSFLVLDTHAGTGFTDLGGGPAAVTGEWRQGIGRLHDRPEPLADYLGVVEALGRYPGSPAIIRALLRPRDRLVACELHPEDHAALRRRFAGDPQAGVHRRDGYAALSAFLPAAERRALVLIDPPFEAADEFDRLATGLATAATRAPGSVLVAWYPIKGRAPVRAFHDRLREAGLRDVVAAEFLVREDLDASHLNGCGLLLVNPPYRLETEVPAILQALADRLADSAAGGGVRLVRLADE